MKLVEMPKHVIIFIRTKLKTNSVMKKQLILLSLLLVSGCNFQQASQSVSKSSEAAKSCPEKPEGGHLDPKDVRNITLSSSTVKESRLVSADKYVGYSFQGKAGQRISYRTSDNICVSVYNQKNDVLKDVYLDTDGQYILQVSVPKGSTSFTLEMSLGTLDASSPSGTSAKSPDTPSSTSPSDTPSSRPSTTFADITEEQALELVKSWYNSKAQIFGPSFDTSLVERYTTGKLYAKTLDSNSETGRIAWLRSHNSYYTYNNSRINKVLEFSNTGRQPWITVNVSEELYLHGPNGIDSTNSGSYTDDFIYLFEKANGVWKISDYHKVNQ